MKSMDEVKREFVHEWLRRARGDLAAARHLLEAGAEVRFGVAFHAQQAAEKLLKAVLVWHQIEFPKTHDIGRLLALVRGVDAALAGALREAETLTPFGVEIRYPGDVPEPTAPQAREAVALAERVRELVLQHLPAEFEAAANPE